nr:hypothetical protein HK105_004159 [Polyrhizophydium stewartii]
MDQFLLPEGIEIRSSTIELPPRRKSGDYSNDTCNPALNPLAIRKLPLDILEDEDAFQVYRQANESLRQMHHHTAPGPVTHHSDPHHLGGRMTPSGWSTTGPVHATAQADSLAASGPSRRGSKFVGLASSGPIQIPSAAFATRKQSMALQPGTASSHARAASASRRLSQLPASSGARPTSGHARALSSAHGEITNITPSTLRNLFDLGHINMSAVDQIRCAQLARSAATLVIQSIFRGWSTRRKFILVVHAKLSAMTLGDSDKSVAGLPGVDDLSVQESLWRRYLKYCGYFDKRNKIPPEFSQFCATYIQANWRCFVVRRAWLEIHTMSDEQLKSRAGLEARIRLIRHSKRPRAGDRLFEACAAVIQRAWRRFYNVRIFQFYRDLIKFSENGDPKRLLKYINPKEAQLIDQSFGAHIRFRLGGEAFPPTIMYKMFVHQNIIDMNSFSPRDYTDSKTKQPLPRQLFQKDFKIPQKDPSEEWYQRFENNDWRPVSNLVWSTASAEIQSVVTESPKKIAFHYKKPARQADLDARRKQRKLEWMRQLYKQGVSLAQADDSSAAAPAIAAAEAHARRHPQNLVKDVTRALEMDPLPHLGGYHPGHHHHNHDHEHGHDRESENELGQHGGIDQHGNARDGPVHTLAIAALQSSHSAAAPAAQFLDDSATTTTTDSVSTPMQTGCMGSKQDVLDRMRVVDSVLEMEMLAREIEADLDPDFLIRWTRALDFDAYHADWMALATTHPAKEYSDGDLTGTASMDMAHPDAALAQLPGTESWVIDAELMRRLSSNADVTSRLPMLPK